jgi:hypothetical protein
VPGALEDLDPCESKIIVFAVLLFFAIQSPPTPPKNHPLLAAVPASMPLQAV